MATASPPQTADSQKPHTRTYQACIPCRRRKVRCDLGPVDSPHDPPCQRCRRESKDCYFSATRRKRKNADDDEEIDEEEDIYTSANSRKRARGEDEVDGTPTRASQPSDLRISGGSSTFSNNRTLPPLTPNGSVGRFEPLRKPYAKQELKEEDDAQLDRSASLLQKEEVFGGHDALNLIVRAAQSNGDMPHHRTGSSSSMPHSLGTAAQTPGSFGSFNSPQAFPPTTRNAAQLLSAIGPDQRVAANTNGSAVEDSAIDQAIKEWQRLKFVRNGWFTAQEGIAYIEHFYAKVAPLTPIVVPDFRDPSKHGKLLLDEPVLAVTMLSISSRFMELTGPGKESRRQMIHSKVWDYLKDMIHRILWGQEQFGGGFCGAGAQPGSDVNPLHRKGLRTLGTVESLMLLTEWHPRALHFPPGADDDELMIPQAPTEVLSRETPAIIHPPTSMGAAGGQRIDSWLEPCWRSDRMCWMLLGNAMSLAVEIGVFDETSQRSFELENRALDPKEISYYYTRKGHLKDLLQIYVTQTSGRLGLTSMLPSKYLEDSFEETPEERLQARMRRHSFTAMSSQGASPISVTQPVSLSSTEMVLHFWTDMASIMHAGNKRMFPNRRETRELIRKGEYVNLLNYFRPQLAHWRREFDKCTTIPPLMRHILNIEYEYCRVYLNCLALQAVVERCTHGSPGRMNAQLGLPISNAQPTPAEKDNQAIPATTLMKWIGNDRPYIREVIDAARNLLRIVTEGLGAQDDILRHTPVRTYFRIISVAIILLKTFALGATEDDVALSLNIMDAAVAALQGTVVDDVHVVNSFCDLCTTLTARIKSRFVRMHANGNGKSRGHSKSQTPPVSTSQPQAQPSSTSGCASMNGTFPQTQAYNNYSAIDGFSQSQYAANLSTTTNGGFRSWRGANEALSGISTETYDPDSNNMTIMPPPTFGDASSMYDLNSGNTFSYSDDSNPYWLALPLDPLVGHRGADVTQTTYGPDIGGVDLLDVLLQGNPGAGPFDGVG